MQKIIVKSFRQIPYAEVDVKNILVFIGEQASGKSTLAKLIYFFKSLKEDYFNLIYEKDNRTNRQLEKLFIKKIQEKFKVYFGYTSELDNDFEITFYYNFKQKSPEQNRFLRLFKSSSLNIQFQEQFFGEILHETKSLAFTINEFSRKQANKGDSSNYIVIERAKIRFINELTERVNNLFFDNYTPLFFPAGRNITVSYPEQFQSLFLENLYQNKNEKGVPKSIDMVLMRSFILHTKFLYDYFRGDSFESKSENRKSTITKAILTFFRLHSEYILKGKYDNQDGNEKIIFDKKGQSIPLNLASSGQQEAVRIIQDLFYLLFENQRSFRIIEEPEAHLYAEAQKHLIELIALVTNKTQSQVLITTHSPYVLSILNNLLMISVTEEKNPNSKEKIDLHFLTKRLDAKKGERIKLLNDEIQVYALSLSAKKYCTSIIDSETGLIGENYLDEVTEDLNDDFNVLYNLNFESQPHE